MVFSRWVFRLAGMVGLVILLPEYFLEEWIGRDQPPTITHPEFFYGFLGVALSWQVAFMIIALDPPRYRLLMIPAIIEKLSFSGAALMLWMLGRTALPILAAGIFDLTFGILFCIAFAVCPRESTTIS